MIELPDVDPGALEIVSRMVANVAVDLGESPEAWRGADRIICVLLTGLMAAEDSEDFLTGVALFVEEYLHCPTSRLSQIAAEVESS